MPKVKAKRQSVSLDMTAMCDVAFLLLTFFILTAKIRPEEAVTVVTPTSISDTKLPESDIMTITVSKEGRIFFGVDAHPVRLGMLDKMAEKKGISFTPAEKDQFRLMENFGVPVANLKQILNMKGAERNRPGFQPGVPCDTINNELFNWVLYARMYNPKLRIAVKGDSDSPYKVMKQIIGTLQAQNINQFNLITGLENKPSSGAKEE